MIKKSKTINKKNKTIKKVALISKKQAHFSQNNFTRLSTKNSKHFDKIDQLLSHKILKFIITEGIDKNLFNLRIRYFFLIVKK